MQYIGNDSYKNNQLTLAQYKEFEQYLSQMGSVADWFTDIELKGGAHCPDIELNFETVNELNT